MPHKYDEKMFDIKHLRKTAEKLKTMLRILDQLLSKKLAKMRKPHGFDMPVWCGSFLNKVENIQMEWKQYKELDYQRIYDSMVQPAFIFDGRNMLDHQKLFAMGFEVYSIGKGYMTHLK